MTFETDRLLLRPWREEDAEALYEYARDPAIGPPAGWLPHTDAEDSRRIIRTVLSSPETYAVCLKADGKPIGSIGFHRNDLAESEDEYELGYWIGRPFWGQGLIPEAAREMLRHAFEDLGMSRIWCGHYDGNDKSRRVQEKLGFIYHHTTEGIELEQLQEIRTGHVMIMTRETWERINHYRHASPSPQKGISMEQFFRSILEQDKAPIVVCDTQSTVVYMNPAAIARYRRDLTGRSVKDCHPAEANQKIDRVLSWFAESRDHNMVYTYRNDEENKDVYMVALRDGDGVLIGYYEKHEYRNRETAKLYDPVF